MDFTPEEAIGFIAAVFRAFLSEVAPCQNWVFWVFFLINATVFIARSVEFTSLIRSNTAFEGISNTSVGVISSSIEWAACFSNWAAAVSANSVKDFTVVLSSGAAVLGRSAVLLSGAPFFAWRAAVWVLLSVLAVVFEIWAAVGVFFF